MLPSKLRHGQRFKESVVKRINDIIDYLKTQRLSGDNNTIKINQNTAGITISALPQTASGRGGKATNLNHPFKLSFVKDAEIIDSPTFLEVKQGRIQINDNTYDRCYFYYFDDNKINLSHLGDGEYYVLAVCQYSPHGSTQQGNVFFSGYILFADVTATTVTLPQTRGIFSIPLGKIKIETKEEIKNYTITEQKIIGDFAIDFQACRLPFSVTAHLDTIQNGGIISSYQLSDFTFSMNAGTIYNDKTIWGVGNIGFQIQQKSYVYVKTVGDVAGIVEISTTTKPFYNEKSNEYCYLIATIFMDKATGLVIEQNVCQDIITGEKDTYKILTKSGDNAPDYISQKMDFMSYSQDKYQNIKSYIGNEFKIYDLGDNLKSNHMQLRWLYKDIKSYDDNKKLCLTVDKGSLKWAKSDDDIDIDVTGSLKTYIKIEKKQEEEQDEVTFTVSWIPENSETINGYSFMTMNNKGQLQHWTPKTESHQTGVMVFNQSPNLLISPNATEDISMYMLTGVNGSLGWSKTINTDDIGKVKFFDDDVIDFLPEKIMSENLSITFKLKPTQDNCYLVVDVNPNWFYSSDKSVKFEDLTDSLNVTIPDLGKIKLTKNGNLGYLQDKLIVDQSIAGLLKLEQDGQQLLIKSTLQGSGLLAVNNGRITAIPAPNQGNFLLGCSNGVFSWMSYANCQDACSQEQ